MHFCPVVVSLYSAHIMWKQRLLMSCFLLCIGGLHSLSLFCFEWMEVWITNWIFLFIPLVGSLNLRSHLHPFARVNIRMVSVPIGVFIQCIFRVNAAWSMKLHSGASKTRNLPSLKVLKRFWVIFSIREKQDLDRVWILVTKYEISVRYSCLELATYCIVQYDLQSSVD